MNAPTRLAGPPALTPQTVLIACADQSPGWLRDLQSHLAALESSEAVIWQVGTDEGAAQIVLGRPATIATEEIRRPAGTVLVAVVAEHDDGAGVVSALSAGAVACVRGTDPALTAAYLRAVARRHGLLDVDVTR
jgi:hypothetical protein